MNNEESFLQKCLQYIVIVGVLILMLPIGVILLILGLPLTAWAFKGMVPKRQVYPFHLFK